MIVKSHNGYSSKHFSWNQWWHIGHFNQSSVSFFSKYFFIQEAQSEQNNGKDSYSLSLSTWPHFHSEYDWVCQGSFPFEKKQKSIIVPPSSVRDRTNLFVCKVAGKEGYWLMSSSLQSKSFSFWNSVAIAIMFLWAVTLRWNFY